MKNLIHVVFGLMIMIAFVACNEEQLVEEVVYAPNGTLVSSSMDDLSKTIADAIGTEKENISLESVSFLEVNEGFIAKIDLFMGSTSEHTQVYYMSSLHANKMNRTSSVEFVETADIRRRAYISSVGTVAFCSCGNNSFPSSGCRVSVTTNPNGSVTGTCYLEGCSFGCAFHSS